MTVQLVGCLFNYSDTYSIARLPVKLIGHLFLMISIKLDSSDKLKMVLLKGYKVLGD